MLRQALSQRPRPSAADRRGRRLVLPGGPRQPRALLGPDGSHDPALHGEPGTVRPGPGRRCRHLREGGAQGRRHAGISPRPAKACPASARRGRGRVSCARGNASIRRPAGRHRNLSAARRWSMPSTSTWSTTTSAPRFIKFCSYFPYNARPCINGHGYPKRRMEKRSIPFGAPGNGIMGRADPAAMRDIAGEIDAGRIDALFRKWLARLPHPFTTEDRAKGSRYDLLILQAECALTQVFDRPVSGRVLFEEIIRENLDIGRADHVQLIFGRHITRRTDSHRSRRRPSVAARRLQAFAHQAALQGGPRAADRDGDQQHVRLRRQAQAAQPR